MYGERNIPLRFRASKVSLVFHARDTNNHNWLLEQLERSMLSSGVTTWRVDVIIACIFLRDELSKLKIPCLYVDEPLAKKESRS